MDVPFLMDRYKWELDRRDKISSSANFPTTILIVLAGALGTLIQVSTNLKSVFFWWLFVPIVIAGVIGAIAGYQFMQAYFDGSEYKVLPPLIELELMRVQLADQEEQDDTPEEEFTRGLRSRIIDATDVNAASNDRRQARFEKGVKWLKYTVCATACCAVLSVPFGVISHWPKP